MSLQQAALQALEALEEQVRRIGPEFDDPFAYGFETDRWALMRKAIAALHEAVAEPVQNEPLAWFRLDEKTNEAFLVYFPSLDGKDWRPLYAMPRKPLSEDEIVDIWGQKPRWHVPPIGSTDIEFARAIERAHGIGEQHE